MSWYGDDHQCSQAYNQYQDCPKHESHLSHELIAGAASYEVWPPANGRPASHAEAKEILAGFSGAFVDKEFETHGVCCYFLYYV
ncbi:hypothetical protein BJV77DRAFT_1028454 [Russula vinacea]|nr:hypothetical protein BJV77DRAFT_1028454 [Russula vinacea]